jgi:hypothetical protein
MAKLLSTIIDGFVKSKDFVSGAFGSGWRIARTLGRWVFETDDIVVRGQMTVFELLIQKIRAVKGALGITQASGKIREIREDDTNYYIQVEDEMSFVANDIVKCQTFSGEQKNYWVIVSNVVNNEIVIPKSEFVNSSLPEVGDEMIQFGNTTDETRQSAIYLHADEGGQPAIDVLFGINSKSFDGKTKIRVGGDIPGSDGYKGFYCENGMIKSVNTKGETMYMLRPDGSGVMAKGNISWDADGNGSIFNKAIYWNATGFHFGSGIKLTWDNLDDTARENLKGEPGEPGKDGNNGLDGADGINGQDGVSIVWQGYFSSHPKNPKNGWAYKNTTDKKSYVYQDGAWYQMTIDGVDGANGKDGNDGLDIVWKGDSSTPPSSPRKNWVYRDTDNGRVYIYNGTSWVLMVADGNDGTDGANGKDGNGVYITYHDSETEPVRPTGNGTTEGWHTNSTASVIWMSQKVASSASSGIWGNPIRIGSTGEANLLPWLSDWNNNKTEIDGESVVSPKMFSGTKGSSGKLTGVAFGRDVIEIDGVKKTGIFGIKDGTITFSIDSETGSPMFKGSIYTPPFHVTSDNFSSVAIPVSGNMYMVNFDKTGLNIQFEYVPDLTSTFYLELPRETRYEGAEASVLNAFSYFSLGGSIPIGDIYVTVCDFANNKVSVTGAIIGKLAPVKFKCIVVDPTGWTLSDPSRLVDGKIVEWVFAN